MSADASQQTVRHNAVWFGGGGGGDDYTEPSMSHIACTLSQLNCFALGMSGNLFVRSSGDAEVRFSFKIIKENTLIFKQELQIPHFFFFFRFETETNQNRTATRI